MRKKLTILIVLFILVCSLLSFTIFSTAKEDVPIDKEVFDEIEKEGESSVIVVMKKNKPSKITGFFTAIVQTKTPREKVLSTLSKDEFKKKHEYSVIEGFSGEITEEGLEKLRNDPNVEKIYFDRVYSLSLTDSVPLINASKVHSYQIDGVNITGDGESVCILDTGVDTDHPSLKNNIIACETFVDGTSTCEDDSVDNWGNPLGHGTHVSGIVAGNGNVIGVAPGANIIAIKVCDSGGLCDSSDILAGLEWCTNNKDTYNISVISLSLGDSGQYNSTNCPEYSDSPGYAAAYAAGIFITAASGNNHHTSGISYPSCNENVTSAGAVTKSDSIDSYTNRGGNILTLLAPGSDITSTANGGGTTTMSGTSMATPHIAGAAAVLQQYAKANSAALTQTQIENALNNTGKPIYDAASDNTYGRISLFEAVKSLTDNSGPELNINSPANSTYNNNISLSLSYSASDVNDVDSIWYNFNGEENNFLTGDTTFNITEGSHVLNLYANDSLGNENSISVDFTVDITLVINLLTQNDSYVKNPVTFEFSLIDPNPDSCSLYGDWNGWHLNETKSYTENNFTINLEDGTYIWNIKCNDTKGNETFADENYTINIDLTDPNITLSSPENNVSLQSPIKFSYIVDDIGITNCSLMINDTINSTDETITVNIDQYFTDINFTDDTYYWKINCTDNIGRQGTSEERILTICTENWTYDGWTTCSGSQQTRTCTDNNNCGTEYGKPAESQSCTDPAPTISGSSGGSSSHKIKSAEPVCKETSRKCTEWSKCTQLGSRSRSCQVQTECGGQITTEIEWEDQDCEYEEPQKTEELTIEIQETAQEPEPVQTGFFSTITTMAVDTAKGNKITIFGFIFIIFAMIFGHYYFFKRKKQIKRKPL